MSLVRYHSEPLKTLGLNGFFDDFFLRDFNQTQKEKQNYIPVNISEENKAFQLELLAPGRNKEDFTIESKNDRLTVAWSKNRKEEEKASKSILKRKEFSVKSFTREFKLPQNIKLNSISASYIDGILRVTVPKKELNTREKKVEIKVA